MSWRRIFAVIAVRIGMIAIILFALMLIREGALMGQEWETVRTEDEMATKSKPWERTPVRYTGEYSDTMGILDSENTIFYQDFHKDYLFACPIGINYFIAVCPQDSLEDYFNQAYLYASGEPASELNRKDIYCMFYDDRTCNMGKEELEILFLQNGYELSIYEGECKGYQVRFYQYGRKDSGRWLYPEHIIMQTWDGGNVYVQDITSIMQRKVMSFISVDDRENPLIIVHSTAMTRKGIPEEELLFWEFDGNCWSLVPLELEIECFLTNARGKTEPGKIEDFNPIYYKDGIAFRTAVYAEDEYGIVSYLKLYDMREVDKNRTFQFALCEESYDYMNYLLPNDGWVNFEIVSQGEEETPLMSGEEFDKITECLDEQVPEIWNEWADYIREQSGGEAHLIERIAGEYLPDDVYRDYEKTEYLGRYYMVYVGEIWEDHSVNWEYFYVSEDFSEVLWYDLVQGMDSEYPVLYLDEWRNSNFYRKLEK